MAGRSTSDLIGLIGSLDDERNTRDRFGMQLRYGQAIPGKAGHAEREYCSLPSLYIVTIPQGL